MNQIFAFTYVDNSNFFIEGQRIAGIEATMAENLHDAIARRILDYSWKPDYKKLRELICGEGKQIGSAKLWGSMIPARTSRAMEESGFAVITYPRSHGKEKKVDVAIAYEIARDLPKIAKENSEIVIVSGDKDFVPVIDDLVRGGHKVCVAFWEHAAMEMKQKASSFFSLNPYSRHLRLW